MLALLPHYFVGEKAVYNQCVDGHHDDRCNDSNCNKSYVWDSFMNGVFVLESVVAERKLLVERLDFIEEDKQYYKSARRAISGPHGLKVYENLYITIT
jgi:hypothetical protein